MYYLLSHDSFTFILSRKVFVASLMLWLDFGLVSRNLRKKLIVYFICVYWCHFFWWVCILRIDMWAGFSWFGSHDENFVCDFQPCAARWYCELGRTKVNDLFFVVSYLVANKFNKILLENTSKYSIVSIIIEMI